MTKSKFNGDVDYEKLSEKALVNYDSILNTYSNEHKDLTYKYLKARDLRKSGYKLKDISKMIGVPESSVYRWSSLNQNPYSLNCIKELMDLELLPLTQQNTPKFIIILKLYAYIFTDGYISEKFSNIKVAGELEDLKLLGQEIGEIFPSVKLSIHTYQTKGILDGRKINGISHCLYINSTALGRLLYVLGAPKGDKVKQILTIPDWVFKLNSDLKKVFLGVLWSAEGSKPIKTTRGYNLCFGMAKDIKLQEHHVNFLNQIRALFQEFDIQTTLLNIDKRFTTRQDGVISQKVYFYIKGGYTNFIRFYEDIPIFAMKKAHKFNETYKHYLDVAKRVQKRELLKNSVLNEAKELFSQGYSTKRTSEIIGVPRSTLRYWTNKKEKFDDKLLVKN
mgnify:CR=1 FL=1